jgi:hypothetical protein
MAEIRIQQQRRSLTWLWLLLVLAIAGGLIWYFVLSPRPATVPRPAASADRVHLVSPAFAIHSGAIAPWRT